MLNHWWQRSVFQLFSFVRECVYIGGRWGPSLNTVYWSLRCMYIHTEKLILKSMKTKSSSFMWACYVSIMAAVVCESQKSGYQNIGLQQPMLFCNSYCLLRGRNGPYKHLALWYFMTTDCIAISCVCVHARTHRRSNGGLLLWIRFYFLTIPPCTFPLRLYSPGPSLTTVSP